MNLYATKKTAAEGMLDIALFLANITHMKTVIEQGAGYRYSKCVWAAKRDQGDDKTVLHLLCIEEVPPQIQLKVERTFLVKEKIYS